MPWKNRIEHHDFWTVEHLSWSTDQSIKSKILNGVQNTFHAMKNIFVSKPYTDAEIADISRTITDLVAGQQLENIDIDGINTEIKWAAFTERKEKCLETYESLWRLKKTFVEFTKKDSTSEVIQFAQRVVDVIDEVDKESRQSEKTIDYVMESNERIIFGDAAYDRLIKWFKKINKSIEEYYSH